MNQFRNKTVLITGASAGVGAQTARSFAKLGANLVLIARNIEALNKIASELEKATQVLVIPMNVTDSNKCDKAINEVINKFGSIDVLINNAGFHARGNVIANKPDDLANMVEVNLTAPIYLSSLVLPYMKQKNSGAIVNVGSLAGRTPLQGAATYSATKAGLRAFTYALSDEVQETNINIGLVSPGPIDTGFIMDEIDKVEDIVFSQPMSTAQQVTDAIINVASGEAVEVSLPKSSGYLTTVSYLFPRLRRILRPILYKKGRKAKKAYRNRNKANE
ncbi:SDR family NAD(P)-dependent oxidoreductase [Pseudoalteromonas sp. C2R02]|uniref:SDR family NAD(P)-dependent oxidoreductase n=1 Tax=Pseudoalteromonas sp. C2R02 TaxID=2841565 RepID=UPI001C09DD9B|nr:SDR family NAD(P)-dependent oxidoreductase [Pseudoalteromonas sp. C2R02]MBU2970210.1 SDR family NAD(P)-dependent oxidoreductase [Pseudoalteromonas sp. C2R02]